jgi:hypothetical protein
LITTQEFLACFRQHAGESFILISSRQPLIELNKWHTENYLVLNLETLPNEEGIELLKYLNVKGNNQELLNINIELKGHALSLVLLAHLLVEYHEGDCRYAKKLPPLTEANHNEDAQQESRHALRVLQYYDQFQSEESRCFLHLLGLFDRPMNIEEKRELIASSDHAEKLKTFNQQQWKELEQNLEKHSLLLGKKEHLNV